MLSLENRPKEAFFMRSFEMLFISPIDSCSNDFQ